MASFVMDMSTYEVEREIQAPQHSAAAKAEGHLLQVGLQEIGIGVQQDRHALPLTLVNMDAAEFLRSIEARSR